MLPSLQRQCPSLFLALAASIVALGVVALSFVSGCNASQRSTAQTAASTVASVAAAAPIACAILNAASPGSGTACGEDAGVVSAVAKLVESILASLPPLPPGMTTGGYKRLVYRGVEVTLPVATAERVQAKLEAM